MRILVTGGAGYVGSVVAEQLLKDGFKVVILDNLRQGHREAVPVGADFVQGDIYDIRALDILFQCYRIDAVMHMAADAIVHLSMIDPGKCFQNNIAGGLNLLDAMLKHNVHSLIFSSSAAVYGEPRRTTIDEEHPKVPINAYGETKLMYERILEWYSRAYGLKYISLRYFNAAGATELRGEHHNPETHLIPRVLQAALKKENPVNVFGTDYSTKDGSCVRDYVHVLDISRAHILALEKISFLNGKAYNLGNSTGYSVMEVLEVARKITGMDIPIKHCARRAGDPAVLVASSGMARKDLDWIPQYSDLESIINSSWLWQTAHPQGYSR